MERANISTGITSAVTGAAIALSGAGTAPIPGSKTAWWRSTAPTGPPKRRKTIERALPALGRAMPPRSGPCQPPQPTARRLGGIARPRAYGGRSFTFKPYLKQQPHRPGRRQKPGDVRAQRRRDGVAGPAHLGRAEVHRHGVERGLGGAQHHRRRPAH